MASLDGDVGSACIPRSVAVGVCGIGSVSSAGGRVAFFSHPAFLSLSFFFLH